MNLISLVRLSAVLLDMDGELEGNIEDFTQEQKTLYSRLAEGINTAYLTIARDIYRPVHSQRVITDSQGRITISSLEKQFVSLVRVEDGGERLPAREGKDYVHCAGQAGSSADIFYYYLPVPLADGQDEPVLPESAVDSRAYAYFAVSLYYTIEKRHSEAAAWDVRFRNIAENIKESRGQIALPARRWR